MKGTMKPKPIMKVNVEDIIRKICDQHFVEPPANSFTARQFLHITGLTITSKTASEKLNALVAAGELKSVRIGKDKYYWSAK